MNTSLKTAEMPSGFHYFLDEIKSIEENGYYKELGG